MVLSLSDSKTYISKNHGWGASVGDRNRRYTYDQRQLQGRTGREQEEFTQLTTSGVDVVLGSLCKEDAIDNYQTKKSGSLQTLKTEAHKATLSLASAILAHLKGHPPHHRWASYHAHL